VTGDGEGEATPRFKLLTIIVNDQDADRVLHALIDAGWPATKIASSGGFLRRNSSTIMLGVPEAEVEPVLTLVRELCASRVEQVKVHPPTLLPILGGAERQGRTVDVHVGGAVLFVLDVERFERI
jgi:uncharacterized protein YaaQ